MIRYESPRVVHLTASRFFGGPERQMLELARELAPGIVTSFISFAEGGLCEPFLNKAREYGFEADALTSDTPRLISAARELKRSLARTRASLLCCHGYKADLLGLWAARRIGIPVVSISRGWTAECWKVRLYESLDRRVLHGMDHIVCVSNGQAEKILRAGAPIDRVSVVHNAVRTERFDELPNAQYRRQLESLFLPAPKAIVGAAGRLSPEKGFDVLIEACRQLLAHHEMDFGVVVFGEGSLRRRLQTQINAAGLATRFVLAGFTEVLDRYMPHFDLFVQASHTEGLPNVLLEAAAARVSVVATNVGGTAEVVADRITGVLVPPDDAGALATAIRHLLAATSVRREMSRAARVRVGCQFSFARQADQYGSLFRRLLSGNGNGRS